MPSSTTLTSELSATHTSSGDSSSYFTGNTPSTVLFFLALTVGVFIAILFVFFTIRYFVRSRFGLHVYPLTRRHNNILVGGTTQPATQVQLTDDELQEHIRYIRSHHYIRGEILERRLLNRGRRRWRRGGRYSRMKKLTEQEVEILFPKKTYHDWLNGGRERDTENRNGALQEEGDLMNHMVGNQSDNDEIELNADGETSLARSLSNALQFHDAIQEQLALEDGIEMQKLSTLNSSDASKDVSELHFTSGTCAICLEVLEDEDIVRGLLCGHVYHADCLDPWLTKRRACCPTCKRDYFFKSESGQVTRDEAGTSNDETNDNVANQDATANATDPAQAGDQVTPNQDTAARDDEDDIAIDLEVLRNDPTLRAMIQELVPTGERVRLILNDSRNAHYNLEERGNELATKKYGNIFRKIVWHIMGITKTDLFNWAVITLYHQSRGEEQSATIANELPDNIRRPEPAAQAETTGGTQDNASQSYTSRDIVDNRV